MPTYHSCWSHISHYEWMEMDSYIPSCSRILASEWTNCLSLSWKSFPPLSLFSFSLFSFPLFFFLSQDWGRYPPAWDSDNNFSCFTSFFYLFLSTSFSFAVFCIVSFTFIFFPAFSSSHLFVFYFSLVYIFCWWDMPLNKEAHGPH